MGITSIEKYNQTHTIRPKLKTINGQSLYSGGNIEIGGSANSKLWIIDDSERIDDKEVLIYHNGLSNYSVFIISVSGYYNEESNCWAVGREIAVPAVNGFESTLHVSYLDYSEITIIVDGATIQVSAAYLGDVLTIDRVYGVKI